MHAPVTPELALAKAGVHHIITGDCREVLARMLPESVNCCVTSPPYWGLRDYKNENQIGLEASLDVYLQGLVTVFREVRRVLKPDGTLWCNVGDSYTNSGRGGNPGDSPHQKQRTNAGSLSVRNQRQDIGNLKPKDLIGMPWRLAFALQQDGWYLRQDIIWHKPNPMPESVRDRCTKAHEYIFLFSKNERYHFDADAIKEPAAYDPEKTKFPDGWDTGAGGHGAYHRQGREKGRAAGNKTHKGVQEYETSDSEEHRTKAGLLKISATAYPKRNKRSVWTIAPFPFKQAHFATFPPALVEPCILAGCPPGGIVLDPFGGAGTTALVAKRLGRNAILIELNPEYVQIAEARLATGGT